MAHAVRVHDADVVVPETRTRVEVASRPAGLRLLQWAFVIVPVIAGVDKFLMMLVDWNKYLAPQVAAYLPMSVGGFMLLVGLVEVVAGAIVAMKPRIGGYIVGAWLLAIVVNLLIGGYWDIALRDLGLALSAFGLASLAGTFARADRSLLGRPAYVR
jgi:hypothetical protein